MASQILLAMPLLDPELLAAVAVPAGPNAFLSSVVGHRMQITPAVAVEPPVEVGHPAPNHRFPLTTPEEVEGVVGWPQSDPSVLDYIHPLALEVHRGHLLNQTTVQVAPAVVAPAVLSVALFAKQVLYRPAESPALHTHPFQSVVQTLPAVLAVVAHRLPAMGDAVPLGH